jgi:hypothetical protein
MKHTQFYLSQLADLTKAAEEVSGQWNGDMPGLAEDRANVANEIIEKCAELTELLKSLEECS